MSEIKILDNIKFETAELSKFEEFMNKFKTIKIEPLQVVKVSELEGLNIDKKILDRIKEMSKLQPLREGVSVVTKQQIVDAYNIAEINNPELLDKIFSEFTNGASKDELKFVSNKKLYNLKAEMEEYIKSLCKNAENGKINKNVLKKVKNKNLIFSGINFAAGFTVAAVFLSTLIPKFQYWVTKMKTGKDDFPGMY